MAKNFKAEIMRVAGQPIEAIVVGPFDQWDDTEPPRWVPPELQNKLLSWEQAAPFLDKPWCAGFGGADCPPIMAWTKDYIVLVGEYDGATGVDRYPRNPVAHEPRYA